AIKRDNQQPSCAVAYSDQILSFRRGHHHRLFQKHIDPSLHTSRGLIVMENMGRNNKSGVDLVTAVLEQLLQIWFVGGRSRPDFFKNCTEIFIRLARWFASRHDLRGVLLLQNTSDVMTGHTATADHD